MDLPYVSEDYSYSDFVMDPSNASEGCGYYNCSMNPPLQLLGDQTFDIDLTEFSAELYFPAFDCGDLISEPTLIERSCSPVFSWIEINNPVSGGSTDCSLDLGIAAVSGTPQSSTSNIKLPSNKLPSSPVETMSWPILRHGRKVNNEIASVPVKRKWDESIIVFSVNSDNRVKAKKRKCYDNVRREEVALTRIVHACIQCKLSKGRVSSNSVPELEQY